MNIWDRLAIAMILLLITDSVKLFNIGVLAYICLYVVGWV